jgi:hypothetical protein
MTICTPHTLTKPLPTCLATLIVGTITDLNASVKAYLYNLTTQRLTSITGASNGAGLVTLDVSELSFSPNHTYYLTLTLAGDDVNSLITVTIGTTTTDQIALRFEDVYASDGDLEMFTVQTLEVVV